MSCDRCDKCHGDIKNVCLDGRGASKPDIMVILDCPTKACDIFSRTASGDVSLKLAYLFERVGIDPSRVYYTTAVKCHVKKVQDIKPKHIKACIPHLFVEIIDRKPKLIIPMGKVAQMALTNCKRTSLAEYRGHFSTFNLPYTKKIGGEDKQLTFSCKFIPTFSPNASLMKWEYDIHIIHDLEKAKKYINTGIVERTPNPEVVEVLSLDQLKDFENIYSNAKAFVTDLETTGLSFFNHEIINAGFARNGEEAHILYLREYTEKEMTKWCDEERARGEEINAFVRENKEEILETLRRVMASPAMKAGHNLKFDIKFLMKLQAPVHNWKWDTMLWDALEDENRPHSLNIVMEWNGINYGPYDTKLWKWTGKKGEKSYAHIPTDILALYLAIDVCGCFRLWKVQLKNTRIDDHSQAMYKLMVNQQLPLAKEMLRFEYKGLKADVDLMASASQKLSNMKSRLLGELAEMTGCEDFNPNSDQQVSAFMEANNFPFKDFKIKKGAKGYSVGKDTFRKFVKLPDFKDFSEKMLEWRVVNKLKGTYVDGNNEDEAGGMLAQLDSKNFIHPSFNLHTARTGRLASVSPNGQNLPNANKYCDFQVRNFFVPPHPHWVMWEADFCLQGDTKVRFANGEDIAIRDAVGRDDLFVYAYNQRTDKIDIAPATNIRRTRPTHTKVKITLDNGDVVESTPDHRFMLRDSREYVLAGDLKIGDSLLSATFFCNNGWKKFNTGKTVVVDHNGMSEFSMYKTVRYMTGRDYDRDYDGSVWHHADFSHTNDLPSNLVQMSKSEHRKLHSTKYWREISPEAKSEYSRKVKERVCADWQNAEVTERRLTAMRSAITRRDNTYIVDRNKDERHIEVRRKAYLAKIDERIREVIRYCLERHIYITYLTWDTIVRGHFGSDTHDRLRRSLHCTREGFPLFVQKLIPEIPLEFIREVTFRNGVECGFGRAGSVTWANKFVQAYKIVEQSGVVPSEKNWSEKLQGTQFRDLVYTNHIKYFGSELDFHRYCKTNHRVVKVEILELDTPEDMYCMTVPEYHNFYLSNGLLSSNCQLELRVIAYLGRDRTMIREFKEDVDLHSRNCVMYNDVLHFLDGKYSEEQFLKIKNFKKPFDYLDLSDDKKKDIDHQLKMQKTISHYRNLAKTLAFGSNYGMEEETMADMFEVPKSDVTEMLELYFAKYSGIAEYREEIKREVMREGMLELPITRRRRRVTAFTDWIHSEYGQDIYRRQFFISKIERQAMNFPVQGLANEIYTRSKLELFRTLREEKIRHAGHLSIHDGMVNSCHIDEVMRIKDIVDTKFSTVLGKGEYAVPLTADFEAFTRWKGEHIYLEDYAMWRERILEHGVYKFY